LFHLEHEVLLPVLGDSATLARLEGGIVEVEGVGLADGLLGGDELLMLLGGEGAGLGELVGEEAVGRRRVAKGPNNPPSEFGVTGRWSLCASGRFQMVKIEATGTKKPFD
jgi:hypothetical protein